MTKRYDPVLVFFGCLALFLFGLHNQDFIGFQTRFAVFAQEMLRNGISFFPTTYNAPYPDYPATSTLLIYLVSLPFNKVTPFTAILPTAITSALIAVVTYKIGALQNRVWGWYGVLFLLFTASFLAEARTIALDQYISLITASCFYLLYSADCAHHDGKTQSFPKQLFYLSLLWVIGFAFRGPIGLIVPASVVAGYLLLGRRWIHLLWVAATSFLLLIICGAMLLWLAYLDGGQSFVDAVIIMQAASRVHLITKNPWGYYFVNSFADYAITYPLVVLLAVGLFSRLIKPITFNDPLYLVKRLLFWALIIFIGFSFANSKRNHYILPAAPALALLSAYIFTVSTPSLGAFVFSLKRIFLKICLILPGLLALLVGAAWLITDYLGLKLPVSAGMVLFLFIIMQIVVLYYQKKQRILLIGAMLSFVILNILIIEPANYFLNQTREFVYSFEHIRHQANAAFGFYNFGRDALAIKFMANLPPEEIEQNIQPLFINDVTALLALNQKVFFITQPKTYNTLPDSVKSQLTLLSTDKIGHAPVFIFGVTKHLGANDVYAFD